MQKLFLQHQGLNVSGFSDDKAGLQNNAMRIRFVHATLKYMRRILRHDVWACADGNSLYANQGAMLSDHSAFADEVAEKGA